MQTSQVGTPHARIFNEATKHHFARISDESTRAVGLDGVDAVFEPLGDPDKHTKILIRPRSSAVRV